MKRKPKISIEEQLYRAGIWERPVGAYLYAQACYRKVPDAARRLWCETVPRFEYPFLLYFDSKTGQTMLREFNGKRWSEPGLTDRAPSAIL